MRDDFGITPELVEHLKKEEGWSAKPYICPAGYPTIGYGHRIPSMDHPPITLEKGIEMLYEDIRFHRSCILSMSPHLTSFNEDYLAALIDFSFNLGPNRYKTSTLRKRIDAKDWKGAAVQMHRWVYARDPKTKRMVKLKGLVRRRATVARWLERPPFEDDSGG